MRNISKKRMLELIITGVLLIVLVLLVVFVVIPVLLPKGVQVKRLQKTTVIKKPAVVLTAQHSKTYVIQKEIPLKKAEKDPFKPETFVKEINENSLVKNFNVTGISILGDTRFAIINDSVKKIGDEILGTLIIAINKNTVVIQKDGKEYTLKIQGE